MTLHCTLAACPLETDVVETLVFANLYSMDIAVHGAEASAKGLPSGTDELHNSNITSHSRRLERRERERAITPPWRPNNHCF